MPINLFILISDGSHGCHRFNGLTPICENPPNLCYLRTESDQQISFNQNNGRFRFAIFIFLRHNLFAFLARFPDNVSEANNLLSSVSPVDIMFDGSYYGTSGIYYGKLAWHIEQARFDVDWYFMANADCPLSFNSGGEYSKWYSDSIIQPDFTTKNQLEFVGGAPGIAPGVQMMPMDFNGDGKQDLLVFKPSTGTYWKWYSDSRVGTGFISQPGIRFDSNPESLYTPHTGSQMIPVDFDGDGKDDILTLKSY